MRKFQQYRDQARGMTVGLAVLLFGGVACTLVVATLALAAITVASTYGYLRATTQIEMPPGHWQHMFVERLLPAGSFTLLLVLGTALYKSYQLAQGGGDWVARSLGGKRIVTSLADGPQRRLVNIVEELSIASGLRVPHIYLLEDEPGINAFAAGWSDKDAVVAVTQGALDRLKRHQLQGVVAHEFSHIAHGDMRLNIRLLGILAGIQSIAAVASRLLRMGTGTSRGRETLGVGGNPLGMLLATAFGLVIWPIGMVGYLFVLLVDRAVNRQREYLADAMAVSYTRDPDGLREALEAILADEQGSRLQASGSHLVSHMCFASEGGGWQRLLQTHPPLRLRIRRLDLTAELILAQTGEIPADATDGDVENVNMAADEAGDPVAEFTDAREQPVASSWPLAETDGENPTDQIQAAIAAPPSQA